MNPTKGVKQSPHRGVDYVHSRPRCNDDKLWMKDYVLNSNNTTRFSNATPIPWITSRLICGFTLFYGCTQSRFWARRRMFSLTWVRPTPASAHSSLHCEAVIGLPDADHKAAEGAASARRMISELLSRVLVLYTYSQDAATKYTTGRWQMAIITGCTLSPSNRLTVHEELAL